MIVAEKFLLNCDEAHTCNVISSFYDKMTAAEAKTGASMDFSREKLMEFVRTSNFDCALPSHAWKKREVGLLLLGSFSDDIIDFHCKHASSFDLSSLISNITSDMSSSAMPILIAKTLWCVARFAEIIASKNPDMLLSLFKIARSCLTSSHKFPVRLTAAKALGM